MFFCLKYMLFLRQVMLYNILCDNNLTLVFSRYGFGELSDKNAPLS